MQNKDWVLFINLKAYPCNIGGIEVFNYFLVQELSKFYNIHVLTFCEAFKGLPKVQIHKIGEPRMLKKLLQPLKTLFFLFQNRRKIKLIHVSYSRGYWSHWYIYVIIKKILGIKYIVTIHGGGLTKWKPNYPYLSFFKNSEVITGVSNRIIKEYENRSKRKLIFTPPLIPFRILSNKKELRKKWGLDPDQTVLLYVGSIKPLKAVDSLIEALSRLSKESINRNQLTIFIAGEGISKKSLELRVFELGLESNIFFLGNIERSKVPELYCIADLYTLCSEFEGLPISLLEAFANKLPCITSDAPGISEMSLNNQNSLMFKTRDSNDYAKKLDSLLNNKELRNKLGKNAYKFYHKNYSYHVLINSFKDIIDKT